MPTGSLPDLRAEGNVSCTISQRLKLPCGMDQDHLAIECRNALGEMPQDPSLAGSDCPHHGQVSPELTRKRHSSCIVRGPAQLFGYGAVAVVSPVISGCVSG